MKRQSNKSGAWERLSSVIQITKMTVSAFAKHIGLPRGENIYQIKKGNNGISFELADLVCEKFPQVSKLWLLTGEGNMQLAMNDLTGMFFFPFRGTRRDWFAGIAFAGFLAAGRFDKTPQCANNIAEKMEILLAAEAESGKNCYGEITENPTKGTYYWYLGMAMFGLLAGRCESTTCQQIKKYADDMYALQSGINIKNTHE